MTEDNSIIELEYLRGNTSATYLLPIGVLLTFTLSEHNFRFAEKKIRSAANKFLKQNIL
jgi:hypothetical protein